MIFEHLALRLGRQRFPTAHQTMLEEKLTGRVARFAGKLLSGWPGWIITGSALLTIAMVSTARNGRGTLSVLPTVPWRLVPWIVRCKYRLDLPVSR